MTAFIKQFLHCMDSKAGEEIPLPLGETVHERRPGEVLHFDYLYSKTAVPCKDGLDKGYRFKYILVMMDDLINFVWLEHGIVDGSVDCEASAKAV